MHECKRKHLWSVNHLLLRLPLKDLHAVVQVASCCSCSDLMHLSFALEFVLIFMEMYSSCLSSTRSAVSSVCCYGSCVIFESGEPLLAFCFRVLRRFTAIAWPFECFSAFPVWAPMNSDKPRFCRRWHLTSRKRWTLGELRD